MAYTYAPTYQSGSVKPETAQKTGLGTAQNIMTNRLGSNNNYPDNYTNRLKAPASLSVSRNVTYNPMRTVNGISDSTFTNAGKMNTVGALKGGDYAALEKALQSPILQQGKVARQQINDEYGGRGLYGSVGGGLMSGAQAASQQATQDALSNATATRYGLEMQDKEQQIAQNQAVVQAIQNALGLRLDNQGQMIDQNKAQFAAGASSADQRNAYNLMRNQTIQSNANQANDFFNKKLANNAQYEIDRNNFRTGVDEINFQRALQLAGMGNSGAQVQATIKAAKEAADATNQAGLWQGLGALGGGLMGSYDGSGESGWNFGDLKWW